MADIIISKNMYPPRVGMMSLVGIWDTNYPLSFGNYCSISNGPYLCNMWAENLEEWARQNQEVSEIEVTTLEHNGKSIGFVSDERLKDWCNKKPCVTGHWPSVAVMREVCRLLNFDTTNEFCGCELDHEAPKISWSNNIHGPKYHCCRCHREWTASAH